MMCPHPSQWDSLSMNLLDDAQCAALQAHAQTCAACRAEFARARREHVALARAYEVFDRQHDSQREHLLAALPATPSAAAHADRARRRARGLGGLWMSLNSAKARTALVLLPAACILAGLVLFFTASPRVALAQVIERLRSIKTMTCQVTTTLQTPEGEKVFRGQLSLIADGPQQGVMYENVGGPVTIHSPGEYVYQQGDQAIRIKLNDADPRLFPHGPDAWLKQLRDLSEDADKSLGRQTIAGHDAVGFEIAGWKLGFGPRPHEGASDAPVAVARLWVDVHTRLPLRYEIDTTGWQGQSQRVVHEQFEWDVPVTLPAEPPAEPTVPNEPNTLTLEMPAPTEASLLDGFVAYREMLQQAHAMVDDLERKVGDVPPAQAGIPALRKILADMHPGFPAQIDAEALGPQVAALTALLITQPRMAGDQAAVRAGQQQGLRIMGIALFYRHLLVDKTDPEYFGNAVTPGDAGAVLLRWKLPDGHFRVVYADLHCETVAAK